jgi:hypothetical protein
VPVLTPDSTEKTLPTGTMPADDEAKSSPEVTVAPPAARVVPVLTPAEAEFAGSVLLADGQLLPEHERHEDHESRHNGVRVVPVLTAHILQSVDQ